MPKVEHAKESGHRSPADKSAVKLEATKDETMRTVTLSMPASRVEKLRNRATVDSVVQPDVFLDPISAAQSRFDELLAKSAPAVNSDGLFLRRASKTRSLVPMSTISLRLLTANVEAVDRLVEAHGAPSRSALCVAALADYLG